jgi:hypothetical protein
MYLLAPLLVGLVGGIDLLLLNLETLLLLTKDAENPTQFGK